MIERCMIEWWWIRHAPVIDPGETLYGRTDLPADLDSSGVVASLDRLAEKLPARANWIVTPLDRSRRTAEALAKRCGAEGRPDVEPDLTEQDFGAWQGKPRTDVFTALGRDHPFWDAPGTTRFPGGESFADVIARIRPVIARRNAVATGRPNIVVGHAGCIRAAIAIALDLSPDAALRLHLDPLGLTRIDAFPGANAAETPVGWRIVTVNALVSGKDAIED